MTTQEQRETARENIKQAQQTNREREYRKGEERTPAQQEAQRRATEAAAEQRERGDSNSRGQQGSR